MAGALVCQKRLRSRDVGTGGEVGGDLAEIEAELDVVFAGGLVGRFGGDSAEFAGAALGAARREVGPYIRSADRHGDTHGGALRGINPRVIGNREG